jgi:hypothetical protein
LLYVAGHFLYSFITVFFVESGLLHGLCINFKTWTGQSTLSIKNKAGGITLLGFKNILQSKQLKQYSIKSRHSIKADTQTKGTK